MSPLVDPSDNANAIHLSLSPHTSDVNARTPLRWSEARLPASSNSLVSSLGTYLHPILIGNCLAHLVRPHDVINKYLGVCGTLTHESEMDRHPERKLN